jgi:diaminopimelate decarboxylase
MTTRDFAFQDNELCCESVQLSTIAERYGTPVYVYSAAGILNRCRTFEASFGNVPHLTCYAIKANANRHILRLIAREGLGADVGSRGELFLALEAGFRPETVTFSGVGKRDDEIAYALERDIHAFNVESVEELDVLDQVAGRLGCTGSILLRVNLDIDAGGHAYVSTSLKENKFGVPHQRAIEVLRYAGSLPHIVVRGIHSHIGSQIVKPEVFRQAATAMASLVVNLRQAGIPVEELDFGGGYGVQYRGYVTHPDLPAEKPEATAEPATMVATVLPILTTTGCRISIQPGRSIVAQAGALVISVLYRKETGHKTFIITDGGMNDLIRPSLYHSFHQIVPVHLRGELHEHVDVVGPVCESGDFFAQDRMLPLVRRGDMLAVMCAGAYGFVLSSNYNARPRVAEVLVDGFTHTVIRERETVEQL